MRTAMQVKSGQEVLTRHNLNEAPLTVEGQKALFRPNTATHDTLENVMNADFRKRKAGASNDLWGEKSLKTLKVCDFIAMVEKEKVHIYVEAILAARRVASKAI